MPEDSDRRRFRLIRGRADAEHHLGRVVVRARPAGAPSAHPPDAVVLEEDTGLIMSASPELWLPSEPLMRVMTQLLAWEPKEPGCVIVRPGRPARLLAVVNDFSEVPAARAEWVAAALARILEPGAGRPLRRIAMPLLGVRHGGLEPGTFLALLREACERAEETPVSELCLLLHEGVSPELLQALDDPPETQATAAAGPSPPRTRTP